jgi:tRNA G10  N-methylase Trm11
MGADLRQNSGEVKCRPQIKLLEYDERFAVFKEFVRYDFEKAIQLPAELKGSFDAIICDPPFLSQDCQTKGINRMASLLDRFADVL